MVVLRVSDGSHIGILLANCIVSEVNDIMDEIVFCQVEEAKLRIAVAIKGFR